MIITVAILATCLIMCLATIFWFIFSKSRKKMIVEARKLTKQERKQILGETYQEIKEQKQQFEFEKEQHWVDINNMKNRLDDDFAMIEKERNLLISDKKRIDLRKVDLEKQIEHYGKKVDKMGEKLEVISSLTQDEAKIQIMKLVEERIQNEIVSIIRNAENIAHANAKQKATDIVISAMENIKTDIVNEKTTNIIKLPNDDVKGKIIGREGRNLKTIEQVGGVEIIIDETPETITVSSFDPIRREIATRVLQQLIKDGRIQPVKIEQEFVKKIKEVYQIILEVGLSTVNELNITDLDIELIKLLGKLKFRSSYGQNVLLHSIETAQIAAMIANELGLDSKSALRAGLLHDIGKAIDFEQDGSHVDLGVMMAKRYGESEIVVNTIASHHEGAEKESEIAAIVAIADAISAARPGARSDNLSDFFIRMKELEAIGNEIPGVAKTYAFQAGRQIRLLVNPIEVKELEMYKVIEQYKKEVRSRVIVPGEITITVIREKREVSVLN